MKRFLLAFILNLGIFHFLNAQQVFTESFNTTAVGSIPSDWIVSSSSDVGVYSRPGICSINDKGLVTPGVGQSAPIGFILPAMSVDNSNPNISIRFKVFVFDPNLKCNSSKGFECPTYVKVYLIPENPPTGSYSSSSATLEPQNSYASLPDYQLVYSNSDNLVILNNVSFPVGVTRFRVQFVFKAASTSNCSSSGTKFIFDDFNILGSNCVSGCSPIANNDYFNSDLQKLFTLGATSFKGHVYGGYAPWVNDLNDPSFIPSTDFSPANDGGNDYNYLNTPLSGVTFLKVSEPIVENPGACTNEGSAGSVIFNSNGTFTYTRTSVCVKRVSFTYKVIVNGSNPLLESNVAKVIIDMPNVEITLPVSFRNFQAARNKQIVALKWETATEQNNRGFNVQRNTKGVWENIAFVFSAADGGNSNSLLSYSFNDVNIEKGVSQYRIQQVDMDNKASYSLIRSVKGEGQMTKTVVYPNPSSEGKVNVVFEDQSAKTVAVSDMSGRLVRQYQSVVNSLVVNGLETGMYTIQITDIASAVSTTEKVIIKKR